jgi:hypothetical protein
MNVQQANEKNSIYGKSEIGACIPLSEVYLNIDISAQTYYQWLE